MSPGTSGGMHILATATVAELPSRPHARVDVDALLGDVVDQMHALGRGCAVIEEDGVMVGIFTERDLLNRIDRAEEWRDIPVHDVMTAKPVAIKADGSLAEAIRHMTTRRMRHLPVVDDRGRVQGLVSIRDVLGYIASKFPEELMNLPPAPHHES